MAEQINWKQRGNVFLWRYIDKERWGEWHMTADVQGAESLLELGSIFQQARWSCKHPVAVSRPTPTILRVPNFQDGEARWSAPVRALVLHSPKAKVAAEHWTLKRSGEKLVLTFGAKMLSQFCDMVEAIERGEGDCAIGPEEDSWTSD